MYTAICYLKLSPSVAVYTYATFYAYSANKWPRKSKKHCALDELDPPPVQRVFSFLQCAGYCSRLSSFLKALPCLTRSLMWLCYENSFQWPVMNLTDNKLHEKIKDVCLQNKYMFKCASMTIIC